MPRDKLWMQLLHNAATPTNAGNDYILLYLVRVGGEGTHFRSTVLQQKETCWRVFGLNLRPNAIRNLQNVDGMHYSILQQAYVEKMLVTSW